VRSSADVDQEAPVPERLEQQSPRNDFRKPSARARLIVAGASLGLLGGLLGLFGSMALNRSSIHDSPAMDYLVVLPALGGLAGYARWRTRHRFGANDSGSPLGDLSGSGESDARRRARRSRYLVVGLGVGCGFALLATLADFAWRGWLAVGSQAVIHVMLFPYLCVLVAFNLSRVPGETISLRDLRLTIRSTMIVVAYLALLFGVGAEGRRLGGAAERYHQQYLSAVSQADLFRGFAEKAAKDAPMRRGNAKELRAGRIPLGILTAQKTFLQSLDKTKDADYRKYRYGLIADGEDLQGQSAESNVIAYTQLARYFDQLARKCAQAERQPWKPVPPDPPRP
jgi:hypothetical protein